MSTIHTTFEQGHHHPVQLNGSIGIDPKDLDENELVLVLSMRCIFMVQSVVASVLKNLEDAAHR